MKNYHRIMHIILCLEICTFMSSSYVCVSVCVDVCMCVCVVLRAPVGLSRIQEGTWSSGSSPPDGGSPWEALPANPWPHIVLDKHAEAHRYITNKMFCCFFYRRSNMNIIFWDFLHIFFFTFKNYFYYKHGRATSSFKCSWWLAGEGRRGQFIKRVSRYSGGQARSLRRGSSVQHLGHH